MSRIQNDGVLINMPELSAGPPRYSEVIAMASSSVGKAATVSVKRISTASAAPPK